LQQRDVWADNSGRRNQNVDVWQLRRQLCHGLVIGYVDLKVGSGSDVNGKHLDAIGSEASCGSCAETAHAAGN
jgi:hypothetical protein